MEQHQDIQAAVREIVQPDLNVASIDLWVFHKQPTDTVDEEAQLCPRRIVRDLHEKTLPPQGTQREILDGHIDNHATWDGDDRVVQCADTRATKPDIFNSSFAATDADNIADAERLLQHDEH